ncbi:MAG TPA: succinate dehydrogenase assembly factor 2 [Rhodospirillales bacterium]|nr:succinate dehydrogenase assembly factor 2 [Rhodospirillales bacterium]
MKENDLLLGRFADHYIDQLDDAQLAGFEHLMGQNDIDILNWITGKETPPEDQNGDIISMIKSINNL